MGEQGYTVIPRRPARRPRWVRLLIGIPLVVVIAFVGLMITAQVLDGVTGCGSVDPTDPANYSEISILNDTATPVKLDDCVGGYCHTADLPARLAPGQRLADDAACAASGTDMTSWRISTEDGRILGYIAVHTPRKHDGLVFPVSHASADRHTPTPPG